MYVRPQTLGYRNFFSLGSVPLLPESFSLKGPPVYHSLSSVPQEEVIEGMLGLPLPSDSGGPEHLQEPKYECLMAALQAEAWASTGPGLASP